MNEIFLTKNSETCFFVKKADKFYNL